MFANLAGLLPLISIASLLIVSANTIGYFSRVGPHFLGFMDLTNFVYPLGLGLAGVMLVLVLLPPAQDLLESWRNVAEVNTGKISGIVLAIYIPIALYIFYWGDHSASYYTLE